MNGLQFFIYIFLFLHPYPSYSQRQNIDELIINADHLEKDLDKNLIHLEGNVHVIYKKYDLLAEKMKIDRNTKTIEAKGHVVLTSSDSQIISEKVIINYKNDTGIIENGFLQMGQTLFSGKLLKKNGVDTYEITEGNYTSCTTCPPAWQFTGSHIKAKKQGYIIIKNVFFKLGKIPIFWLPFLAIPSNTKRHTGLLFPTLGYGGDDGFIISESFFWAMSPYQDTTWTLKHYSQRGLKGLLNYRYILSQKSRGELNLIYLKDKIYNPEELNILTEKNRWHIDYNHQYELSKNINHNVSLNINSDVLYPLDFPNEAKGWGDPALENKISFSKSFKNIFINTEAIYFLNLLKGPDSSGTVNEVHKLPEITYLIMPQKIGSSPLRWEFDLKYTNFLRDLPYDNRNDIGSWIPQDGVFNPDVDLIRAGQRLDFLPSLSLPFHIGPYIEMYPKITYRETRYWFNTSDDRSVERRLLRTHTSIRTRFSKIYGENSKIKPRYRHEIEPEITHTSLPWIKLPSHPFFPKKDFQEFFRSRSPITDNDLIQFDYHDRLTEKNVFTFSLTNRLVKKEWVNDVPLYREITSLKIWQSFDYYESLSQNPLRQPWSELSALLNLRLPYLETNTLFSYFPYQKTTSLASRLKSVDQKGNYLQLTYSRSFTINSDNTVTKKNISEDLGFDLGIVLKYAKLSSGSVYSLSHKKWSSYESRLDLYPPGDCWVISFALQNREPENSKKLNYAFNISFLFNDKTKNLF